MTRVAILGSTGSIGRQTLDVIRAYPRRFQVNGLAGGRNLDLLVEQAEEFRPSMISCVAPADLSPRSDPSVRIVDLCEMVTAPDVDIVLAAIVGKDGLAPVLAALEAGKTVALANKEAMVMAGPLLVAAAERGGGEIRPVDSEHSALWQCLAGEDRTAVKRLVLTASGGALRDLPVGELAHVDPVSALKHPTWDMGRRITIDSATLFNKGLEVIEARWLFGFPYEQIDIVLHRESIIHSMVETVDGSIKAQISNPDMRLPILYALSYPERLPYAVPSVDFIKLGALHFGEVDMARYPCLGVALEAGLRGGTCPAAIAAADEEAVEAFLAGRIGFMDIPALLADTLDRHSVLPAGSLDVIMEADAWAREYAQAWIEARPQPAAAAIAGRV